MLGWRFIFLARWSTLALHKAIELLACNPVSYMYIYGYITFALHTNPACTRRMNVTTNTTIYSGIRTTTTVSSILTRGLSETALFSKKTHTPLRKIAPTVIQIEVRLPWQIEVRYFWMAQPRYLTFSMPDNQICIVSSKISTTIGTAVFACEKWW